MATSITIEAVYENGVFRPTQPLTVDLPSTVQLIVRIPRAARPWPADVAEIYQELAEEDRKLANSMWPHVAEAWPEEGDKP